MTALYWIGLGLPLFTTALRGRLQVRGSDLPNLHHKHQSAHPQFPPTAKSSMHFTVFLRKQAAGCSLRRLTNLMWCVLGQCSVWTLLVSPAPSPPRPSATCMGTSRSLMLCFQIPSHAGRTRSATLVNIIKEQYPCKAM